MTPPKVLILAIDGGGIRGIIPAYFLQELERELGKSCYQLFDVIGGTSTGGIISLALTTPNPHREQPEHPGPLGQPDDLPRHRPFTAHEVLEIYRHKGADIFAKQCGLSFHAKYHADDGSGHGVEPFLQQTIGPAITLCEARQHMQHLPEHRVQEAFTTGYVVSHSGEATSSPRQNLDFGPYLFSWEASGRLADHNYCVWEAARGTSAAPVYFPIASLGTLPGTPPGPNRSTARARWVVDGGTMSNDPAMWGITQALRFKLASSLSEIAVISIGTGLYRGGCGVGIHNNQGLLVPDKGNWSGMPWVVLDMDDLKGNESDATLLNVMFNSVQQVTDAQLRAMTYAGLTYFRLEPGIPLVDMAMDDVSETNVNNLLSLATDYIYPATCPDPHQGPPQQDPLQEKKHGAGYKTFCDIVNFLRAAPPIPHRVSHPDTCPLPTG